MCMFLYSSQKLCIQEMMIFVHMKVIKCQIYHLQALYASKIVSYAQGFMLMREAAKEFNWHLNYGSIALMWRGGCIIRRYSSMY